MANIKDRYKGSHNTAALRTNIYERRVLADTTPGTLRSKTLTSALYKWHYDNGLFDSIKFLWAGEAGIRYSGGKVNKAYSMEQYNQIIPRRNLLTYTEEFDNAVWSKLNVTVTPNAISNHLGVNSADLITESTGSGFHLPYQSNFSFVSGTTYTLSIYVKPNGRTKLNMGSGNVTIWKADAIFDTVAMTATPTQVGCTASIIDVGSGWYRLSLTGVAISSQAASVNIIVLLNNSGASSYTGDGTSGTYIWGAQLEIGSTPTAYQRVTDATGWDGNIADATQTVSGNQPYISGHIAPNETYCLKNVNGGAAYMTHPTISFAANQAWSVTMCLNTNGGYVQDLFGNRPALQGVSISFQYNEIYYKGTDLVNKIISSVNLRNIIGKNTVLTFTTIGDGNFKIYVNGIYVSQISGIVAGMQLAEIFRSRLSGGNSEYLFGNIYTHQINSAALTATQVQSLHNTIRGFIPEIPSVVIGSQTWATSNLSVVASSNGTLVADGNAQATWVGGTAFWCHHTDAATGAVYDKLYNKAARDIIVANPPSGWHVATEAELTALAALGGASLKLSGSTYWNTANGTNSTGLSLLGGSKRNADGTFGTIKSECYIWCANSDKVLKLTDAGTATIENITSANDGYSIRLVKN